MLNTKTLMLFTVSALLALPAAAERPWPDTTYHCQVVTAAGTPGLVSLQSFSLEKARKEAVGMSAATRTTTEQAVSVVQCIEQGTEQEFSDLGFRGWVNTLME